jgi:Fe-S cluster assembly protein SufD
MRGSTWQPARLGKLASRTDDASWQRTVRAAAHGRLDRLGTPTRSDEAWRYFQVRPLQRLELVPATGARTARVHDEATLQRWLDALPAATEDAAARLVLVDGYFVPELSEIHPPVADALATGGDHGGFVGGLAAAVEAGARGLAVFDGPEVLHADALAAMNSMHHGDGALVDLPGGAALTGPVEIVHLLTGELPTESAENAENAENGSAAAQPPAGDALAAFPRTIVRLGRQSEATVIERFAGLDGCPAALVDSVTQLHVGDGATLRHVRVVDDAASTQHIGLVHAAMGRDATLASTTVSLGGAQSRTATHVSFSAPGASARLDGVYVGAGRERHDLYTVVDHAVPRCGSDQLFKGVLADRAVGSYMGRALIKEGAAGSSAHQLSRSLLLDETAVANTKPQLEIDTDDVTASHGATVGALEEDALFYLRSRGIPRQAAEAMLTEAFALEVTARIDHAGLRAQLEARLQAVIAGRAPSLPGAPSAGADAELEANR